MFQRLKKNKFFQKFYSRLFGGNHFRGARGNRLAIDGLLRHTDVELHGKDNSIVIHDPQYVDHLQIFINGDRNTIVVEKNCLLKDLTLWIEDDGNEIHIGQNTIFCGTCQLSCIEGTAISIGENCMFSGGIDVRTGDAHSIVDENGDRINPSHNVLICNHVWIGRNVSILKGAKIADNSICGTGAIVTKQFEQRGVVLAGSPAKIMKENISWKYERV